MEISKKEIELRKMGFVYNEHQECYTKYIYGNVYYVDKWELEEIDIDSLKKTIERDKRWLETSDDFKCGKISAEKEFKKKLKDTYNKYNSWLKQLNTFKFDKTVNQEARIRLEAKVELLKELMNGKQ